MDSKRYWYVIKPRLKVPNGGFSLHFYEDDEEVGGGIFPLKEGSNSEDALRDALADATEEGEKWYLSRPADSAESDPPC